MAKKKLLEDVSVDGWALLDSLIMWAEEEYCAEQLSVSVDTMCRRIKEKFGQTFAEYRDKKRASMKTALFKKQYDIAMAGNVTMLIWLGKNYLGQTDKQETTLEAGKTITLNYSLEGKE